jgi:hypothetical protein
MDFSRLRHREASCSLTQNSNKEAILGPVRLNSLPNGITAQRAFTLWDSLDRLGTGRMFGEEANRLNQSLISFSVIERGFPPSHSRDPWKPA